MIKTNKFVNKKNLMALVVILLIGLLIYVLFIKREPTPKPIDTTTPQPAPINKYEYPTDVSPNPSIRNIDKISLVVEEKILKFTPSEIPQTLEVYEYERPELLSKDDISKLADSFKLGPIKDIDSPVQGQMYIAGNEKGSLVVEVDGNTLALSLTKPESTADIKNININEFINKAKSFVNLIGIDINKYSKTKYAYIVRSPIGDQIVDTPENAEDIEIIFEATTPNSYPLIDKNFSLDANKIIVVMNSAGEVLGTNIQIYGKIKDPKEVINIKDKETVIEELKAQKAVPFNLEAIVKNTSISSTARDITLSYIRENNTLIPVYVINANTNLSQPTRMRGTAEIQFILDARKK